MKITKEKDYILVEPSEGIDFWEIIEGIGKLFTMDGFPQKMIFGNSVKALYLSYMRIFTR
jgi:hypothetical protein